MKIVAVVVIIAIQCRSVLVVLESFIVTKY